MPVFVQLALALTLGGIGTLLLFRRDSRYAPEAPDVKAATTAAEAVALIALNLGLLSGLRGRGAGEDVEDRTTRAWSPRSSS